GCMTGSAKPECNLPEVRLRVDTRDDIFDDANGDLAVGDLESAVEKYRRCVDLDPQFFFISAIPRACQPSKNCGSRSTQRRYFSTALSKSPTARSPFASSKMSSRVSTRSLTSGKLHSGFALPVMQPFEKDNLPFVI